MSDFLETIHFTSASEFLDYLQLRNPRWLPHNSMSSPWVFRGQRKAEWGLLPHAFRNTLLNKYKDAHRPDIDIYLRNPENNWRFQPNEFKPVHEVFREMLAQIVAEYYAVNEFINLADEVGHLIPEDSYTSPVMKLTIKHLLEFIRTFGSGGFNEVSSYKFPYPQSVEYAMAQHHGIPTRLLDWSFSPFVATFFAAEEALYNDDDPQKYDMAVWAINHEGLSETPLQVVRHKRGKISYLRAQNGLFIYDQMANSHFVQEINWRTFEGALKETSPITNALLRKVTLPAAQAGEVLRLLATEQITRAHIMPTLDNVSKTLETNQRIQHFPSRNNNDNQ